LLLCCFVGSAKPRAPCFTSPPILAGAWLCRSSNKAAVPFPPLLVQDKSQPNGPWDGWLLRHCSSPASTRSDLVPGRASRGRGCVRCGGRPWPRRRRRWWAGEALCQGSLAPRRGRQAQGAGRAARAPELERHRREARRQIR
jgi:hypothetical protein